MAAEAGAAPDIIYVRGLQAKASPNIDFFNRKECFLILFEIGFYMGLGCHKKLKEKTEKYILLVTALRRHWDGSTSYASPSATPAQLPTTPCPTSRPR
jgi:hypothetical protein